MQGVFFRDSIMRMARRLGVRGWVRNLPDGSVEAQLDGPADALEAIVDFCHEGPPAARVDKVIVNSSDPSGETEFRIIR